MSEIHTIKTTGISSHINGADKKNNTQDISFVSNLSTKTKDKDIIQSRNKTVNEEDINKKTLESLQSQLNAKNLKVNYFKDDSGHNIMEIRDTETEQIIRQIPTKEQIAIAESIDNFLSSYNKSGVHEQVKTSILNEKAQ